MPLSKESVVAPSAKAVRVSSNGHVAPNATAAAIPATPTLPSDRRTPKAATATSSNGHTALDSKSNGAGMGVLIAEAEALKEQLKEAYTRTSRLLIALRRQRKQADVVRATLASLRQLQNVGQ